MDEDTKSKNPVKLLIKIAVILISVPLAVYLVVGIVFAMKVATVDDNRISNSIRTEFKTALETNFQRQLEIVSSPRRGKTVIYVKSEVSDDDKKKLEMIAEDISTLHSNRPVRIVYGTGY